MGSKTISRFRLAAIPARDFATNSSSRHLIPHRRVPYVRACELHQQPPGRLEREGQPGCVPKDVGLALRPQEVQERLVGAQRTLVLRVAVTRLGSVERQEVTAPR